MSNVERPSPDVLVLRLSQYHSLDIVRLPKNRKYRIVFAERFGVQRRAFVEISFEDAMSAAKFLASIGSSTDDDNDEPDKLPPLPLPLPAPIEPEGTRPYPPSPAVLPAKPRNE
jgi:hypothetical protein